MGRRCATKDNSSGMRVVMKNAKTAGCMLATWWVSGCSSSEQCCAQERGLMDCSIKDASATSMPWSLRWRRLDLVARSRTMGWHFRARNCENLLDRGQTYSPRPRGLRLLATSSDSVKCCLGHLTGRSDYSILRLVEDGERRRVCYQKHCFST